MWIGTLVGSSIGGFIPTLWGASFLDFSSILLSGIGAFIGLWLGFKISQL
jgi:hypothetical protein